MLWDAEHDRFNFVGTETTCGWKGWIYQIKKDYKKSFYLPLEELLDGVGDEAEQFDLPCPNFATEDTYGDGGEDDVRGRREDSVSEVAAAKRFVAGIVES